MLSQVLELTQPLYLQSATYDGLDIYITSSITNTNNPTIVNTASAIGSNINDNDNTDTITDNSTNTNNATSGKKKKWKVGETDGEIIFP